jgi:hypothetical protein
VIVVLIVVTRWEDSEEGAHLDSTHAVELRLGDGRGSGLVHSSDRGATLSCRFPVELKRRSDLYYPHGRDSVSGRLLSNYRNRAKA